jgi:hypothetical protein
MGQALTVATNLTGLLVLRGNYCDLNRFGDSGANSNPEFAALSSSRDKLTPFNCNGGFDSYQINNQQKIPRQN